LKEGGAVTIAYPAKPLGEPDPEPGEVSLDDDSDTAPMRRHLSLVVSADGSARTASRRESMARHPSAVHRR